MKVVYFLFKLTADQILFFIDWIVDSSKDITLGVSEGYVQRQNSVAN